MQLPNVLYARQMMWAGIISRHEQSLFGKFQLFSKLGDYLLTIDAGGMLQKCKMHLGNAQEPYTLLKVLLFCAKEDM
eukprot:scaffold13411_cov18-Tisochrysis_lutea.AAC.1